MPTRDWKEIWAIRAASTVFLLMILAIFVAWMVGPVMAQSRPPLPAPMRGYGLEGLVEGLRSILSIAGMVVGAGILAYYHWRLEVRDLREAAWLAVAWGVLVYVSVFVR